MSREHDAKTIEALLNDLGGCGRFQFVTSILLLSVKVVSSMSMIVMAFGNYNPGWQCLDNSTNWDHVAMDTNQTSSNDTDQCRVFESCANVQFTPGVITVVSEWQLVCDRSWISSLIISIQMAGVLLGSYLSGYLGDKFGRKRILYTANLLHLIFNVVAMFSNSWQFFATMRFLIGVTLAGIVLLPPVHAMEFAHSSWRNSMSCIPVWATGCMLCAISAMVTENWRHVHATIAAASFITLFPFFWVPESLRWLVVKDKMENSMAVVKKIASMNGKKVQDAECVLEIAARYKSRSKSRDYSCLHLMRRGVRSTTFAIGFMCICFSIIYYAISFGVASLPGNLYTNMIIMYAIEFPSACISSPLPNYIGRKKAVMMFLSLCTVCLMVIVALDRFADGSPKNTGTLVGALLARVTADSAWDITVTYAAELYPTVVRSTAVAYTSCISRIGGIVAPYLIPKDPNTHFINYSVMAVCSLVCCGLLAFFPETKGRPMPDIHCVKGDNKGKFDGMDLEEKV